MGSFNVRTESPKQRKNLEAPIISINVPSLNNHSRVPDKRTDQNKRKGVIKIGIKKCTG